MAFLLRRPDHLQNIAPLLRHFRLYVLGLLNFSFVAKMMTNCDDDPSSTSMRNRFLIRTLNLIVLGYGQPIG